LTQEHKQNTDAAALLDDYRAMEMASSSTARLAIYERGHDPGFIERLDHVIEDAVRNAPTEARP